MKQVQEVFDELFADRMTHERPGPDDVVFGPGNRFGIESMDTLRFMAALLPVYGDKVYDLRLEDLTTLASISEELEGSR